MIKFFINPFNVLLLLVLIGCIISILKWKKSGWFFFLSAGVLFLLISTPLIPGMVLNSLENRYQPVRVNRLSDKGAEFNIVVLGGGHGFDDRLPPNSLLSLKALGRLTEGIRLHRQLPNSTLILSGYSASGRTTQAEMLYHTALLLGIDEGKMKMQKQPANTYEEAKVYSDKFTREKRVILVTSAAHMPRAVKMFNVFGVNVIPSPTNYRIKSSNKKSMLGWPSMSNISHLHTGLYEYAGIIRYSF